MQPGCEADGCRKEAFSSANLKEPPLTVNKVLLAMSLVLQVNKLDELACSVQVLKPQATCWSCAACCED